MRPERRSADTPLVPTSASVVAEVRAYVERHRATFEAEFASPEGGGEALGRKHARVAEGLLRALFAAATATNYPSGEGLALVAIGSFGRGAVALRSDLDVRLLCAGPREVSAAAAVADAMLYPLWDAGVQIGHQVVTPAELIDLARTDLPTATSLLDARHLAGDARLSTSFAERGRRSLFGDADIGAFVARLRAEVEGRRARFGGSVYLLEPDVKSGAGGVRDLDIAWWAAKARWGVGEPAELVRRGVLAQREADAFNEARALLWRVRNRLHRNAGRRSERLTFDQQEILAPELGYGEGGAGVEALMSAYYRRAREVTRLDETVMLRAAPATHRRRPREDDLGRGVRLFDGQASVEGPAAVVRDPALSLRLYSTAIARDVALYPYARDAVSRAVLEPGFAETLRASPEAAACFVDLCTTAKETRLLGGSPLGDLHEAGLLVAMVPEFSPVVGRVHHDIYHVYTVDIHSIAAVDRLRALARGDLADEFPLACRLAAEIARPRVLYLATLLHDVGKSIGGRDHAERGAQMATEIGARLGIAPDDVEQIARLVRAHLVMYHVATRRDLDDPATIAEFVREARGREGLRELYLLTVADVSTTSPTAMTRWKGKMLDDLFLAADRYLAENGAPGAVTDDRVSAVREAVLARAPEAAPFVANMRDRYLLSNAPEAIAAHAAVAARAERGGGLAVALSPRSEGELAELCVAAPDRPGTLAAITAAIAAARLEIHAAQIHSRSLRDGSLQALDLFWVRGNGLEGEAEQARTAGRVERALGSVLDGSVEPASLLGARPASRWSARRSPGVRTEVNFDHVASRRFTIIEIIARDRPGLLFTLADALHRAGLSVALAKINTEGDKVADVFYVTEADGGRLMPGPRTDSVRTAVLSALAGGEEQTTPS